MTIGLRKASIKNKNKKIMNNDKITEKYLSKLSQAINNFRHSGQMFCALLLHKLVFRGKHYYFNL